MAVTIRVIILAALLSLAFVATSQAAYVEGTCQNVTTYKDKILPDAGGPNAMVFICRA